MTTLHDLQRALFPTARPIGSPELTAERGQREVGWVRVLKHACGLEARDGAGRSFGPRCRRATGQGTGPRPDVASSELSACRVRSRGQGEDAPMTSERRPARPAADLHLGRGRSRGLEAGHGFLVNLGRSSTGARQTWKRSSPGFALRGGGMASGPTSGAYGPAVVIEGRRGTRSRSRPRRPADRGPRGRAYLANHGAVASASDPGRAG